MSSQDEVIAESAVRASPAPCDHDHTLKVSVGWHSAQPAGHPRQTLRLKIAGHTLPHRQRRQRGGVGA